MVHYEYGVLMPPSEDGTERKLHEPVYDAAFRNVPDFFRLGGVHTQRFFTKNMLTRLHCVS